MSELHEGIFVTSGVLHPKSRGDIRLQSTNPTDQPRIDPKLLDHRDDVRTLIAGVCCSFLAVPFQLERVWRFSSFS